jgi:hypothetical protein
MNFMMRVKAFLQPDFASGRTANECDPSYAPLSKSINYRPPKELSRIFGRGSS